MVNENQEPKKDVQKLQDDFGVALKVYYKRLFPHKQFYKWLRYGKCDSSVFTHREIAFTLAGDAYIRFQSFEEQPELEREICNRVPCKIDIGAVYNFRPKNRMSVQKFEPTQREITFDIDMTDYDPVRTCCQEANVCEKCWKFMVVACKVLDVALREDFGFNNLLWVFSGRRGIHCWVCDKTARELTSKGRSAVAEYFNILQSGGPGFLPRINIGTRMHSSVKRAFKIIEPYFTEVILEDQDLFASPEGRKLLINYLPDEKMRNEFVSYLGKVHQLHSPTVWNAYVNFVEGMRTSNKGIKNWKLRHIIEETQMAFLYPRLDIHVSKTMNHLLKAPFCVHPKTGKVCVPFNPSTVSKFNPNDVPTVKLLMEEIDKHDEEQMTTAEATQSERARIKDYKKTSMFKGIVVFEEFLRKLDISNRESMVGSNQGKLDF